MEFEDIKMEENIYSKLCFKCGKTFYSKGKAPVGICKECEENQNNEDYKVKYLGMFIEEQNEYFRIIKEELANRKTPIYHIETIEDAPLGEIKWYGAWRKFCFFPNEKTIWDGKCLDNVIKFLNEKNKEWREKK